MLPEKQPSGSTPEAPLWLKLGFTTWILVWAPFYWWWYGPANFLWFCDMANFVIAAALWRGSSLLFSWQAVSVLLVQLLWTLDLAGRLLVGRHLIGGSEYMFESSTPLVIRLLSLFHGVTPFLLLWALRRYGYDRRALGVQVATCWIALPVCFLLFGPERNINWVWGPFDRPQHIVPPGVYLAVCMTGYPILLYLPTHLLLRICDGRRRAPLGAGASRSR